MRFVFFSFENSKRWIVFKKTAKINRRQYYFFFAHSLLILTFQTTKKIIIFVDLQQFAEQRFVYFVLLHFAFSDAQNSVQTSPICQRENFGNNRIIKSRLFSSHHQLNRCFYSPFWCKPKQLRAIESNATH